MTIYCDYYGTIYEWNPEKASQNITNHGISFETAALVFDNEITYETLQYIDGEERLKTVGPVYGFMVTVISIERPSYIRIILSWPSTAEEIKLYIQERNKQGSIKNREKRRWKGGCRHE